MICGGRFAALTVFQPCRAPVIASAMAQGGDWGRRSGPSAPLVSTLGVDPPRWRSRINRSTPEAAHTVYVPWRLISFDLSQDSELSTTGFAPRLTDGHCSPFAGMLRPLPACRC